MSNNSSDSQDTYTLMEGQDGTEFVVTDKGVPYASIRATARMLGVDKKSICNAMAGRVSALKGGGLNPVINAKVQTPGGLQGGDLLDAVTVYYLACYYKPELARQMGVAGAAVYMLKQVGYQVKAVEQSNLPTDKLGWMKLAVAKEEEVLALAAQIEADSGRTALGAAIEVGKEHIRIGDMAKQLGVGQNKYFQELRDCGVIMASGVLPYQKYMKYFKVTQVEQNSKWYLVAVVNAKGQIYLAKKHKQWIAKQSAIELVEQSLPAIV